MLQWNKKWFFSRHVQFDSGFQKSFLASPSYTTMSLEVVLKIRVILFEDFLVLLLGLGDPGLRWMSPEPDHLERVLRFRVRLGICNFSPLTGVNTSFVLSLRAWSSDASTCSNSSMSATKMSPCQILPDDNTYPRNFPGKTSGPN